MKHKYNDTTSLAKQHTIQDSETKNRQRDMGTNTNTKVVSWVFFFSVKRMNIAHSWSCTIPLSGWVGLAPLGCVTSKAGEGAGGHKTIRPGVFAATIPKPAKAFRPQGV